MKPGETFGELEIKGRRVLLRSPDLGDVAKYQHFTNALVKEKIANPNLAIIAPNEVVDRAEAQKALARVVTRMGSEDLVSIAAFADATLIGTCDIDRPRHSELRHTGLLGIAILDGYRGMGLGELMVSEALKQAKKSGIWLVELRVFSSNPAAIGLYEKVGFRKSGVVPNMILKNGKYIDDIQMYIDLRDNR